jgi:hypothetical protein
MADDRAAGGVASGSPSCPVARPCSRGVHLIIFAAFIFLAFNP